MPYCKNLQPRLNAHFVAQGFAQEEVYPLHEFTSHMHAKPCGQGLGKIPVHLMTLNFRAILEQLLAHHWEGIISCECIWPVQSTDMTRHPAIQNALMAHKLDLILTDLAGLGPA